MNRFCSFGSFNELLLTPLLHIDGMKRFPVDIRKHTHRVMEPFMAMRVQSIAPTALGHAALAANCAFKSA